MTECIVEISGNTTEMVLDSIKKANEKIQQAEDSNSSLLIKEIRLFNVDLARLNNNNNNNNSDDEDDVDVKIMFEDLLNSQQQYWERVVICLCRGDLSPKAAQGILNTKRLEVYGNTLNLLHFYAKMQQQSSESSTKTINNIEIMKLRTRFDRTSIIPLSEIISSSSNTNTNTNGPSSSSSSLKALNLTCEFTDRESMISMANAFNQNKNLEHLTMYSCEFFDESSIETLIRSLVNHPTLSTLALQDNNHLGMSAVTELISTKTTRGCLNSLILYHPPLEVNVNVNGGGEEVQKIPQVDVESLSIALKQNTSLKSLDLSSNGLNDVSAMCLALALRLNTTLKSLNLQGNMISDHGAMALGRALPEMNLRELYLWNNKFCGVGARALLAGLKHNMVLETITTYTSFSVSKELQYYTHLNRAGRAQNVLSDPNSLPMNVWPLVLDRVNSQQDWDKCSVLYTLLREGPVAISS